MRRVLKALGSLAVLITLLIGSPLALRRVGRLDVARSLDWTHLLTTADDGRLVLLALTCLGWLAWAAIALSLLVELVAMLSRERIRISLPGLRWLQPIAATLLLAVVGLLIATPGATKPVAIAHRPTAAAAPTPSAPTPSATTPSATTAGPSTASRPNDASADGTPDASVWRTHPGVKPNPTTAAGSALHQAAVSAQGSTHYVVAPGDDLWTLAVTHYGDGTRWRTIVKANPGLDPTGRLKPGQILVLPGVNATAPALASSTPPTSVTVAEGDTLSSIARQDLGDSRRWPQIVAANPQLIKDPDHIEAGWRLSLPSNSMRSTKAQASPSSGDPSSGNPSPGKPSSPSTQSENPSRSTTQQPVGRPPESSPRPATASASPQSSTAATPTRPAASSETTSDRASMPSAPTATTAASSPGSRVSSSESRQAPAADTAPSSAVVAASTGVDEGVKLLAGSMGGLLALSLIGGLAHRRRVQLQQRPVGRRIVHPATESQRFETALAGLAATQPATSTTSLTPATILLGEAPDATPVTLDLMVARINWITGPDATVRNEALAGIVTSLLSASWSEGVSLHVAGGSLEWAKAFDNPALHYWKDSASAIEVMERHVESRRRSGSERDALDEAEPPDVFCLADPLSPDLAVRLNDALSACDTGVCALVLTEGVPGEGDSLWVAEGVARLASTGQQFVPQLLEAPARHALIDLFDTTSSLDTVPAPWWSAEPNLPVSLTAFREPTSALSEENAVDTTNLTHPLIRLLGPIELLGAQGTEPSRAVKQCIEYAAWIHLHPRQTSVAMARALLVAEGTRRSNMSRLRSWLGDAPTGDAYLPEAYSGRIELHPGISSDWEHLQTLIHGGVNRASSDSLIAALRSVRGAPLADAAPGQWHWAEEVRTDMVSTIRDIGVVLADRVLTKGDIDTARWAAARALVAAPDDELLLCARIRTEYLAANQPEVERLVLQITRQARQLGIDLHDETIDLLQEVVEGRPRARLA